MIKITSVLMVLALALYTTGVWSERKSGRLKRIHLLFFWSGFVCDAIGTHIMSIISSGWILNFHSSRGLHGIMGAAAILLMFFHAAWASWVLIRNNESLINNFHRFSVCVWCFWLIPFFMGMFMGILK